MLDKEILDEYNRHRVTNDKSVICHAPFTNINFAQNGNMTACCFNRSHIFGQYPKQTIREAWYGEPADRLRGYIRKNDLGGGCKMCGLAFEVKNFSGAKAGYYDSYVDVPEAGPKQNFIEKLFGNKQDKPVAPPRVFEFELSNTCNLECVMCDGYFSSTIRNKREHLPPVKNPYDDKFVEEVASFLPGITDLKFLGGEPFLIEIYLKIWERVLEINPGIKIHITTNGSVMNSRIKNLLDRLNCGIVVSMDSLNPAHYAAIRKGAELERTLENMEYFRSLAKTKNTYFSIAACPMRQNWQDIPALVDYANERDISIHFNIVWNPQHVSLRFEKAAFLRNVIATYSAYKPAAVSPMQQQNYERFMELTNQVKYWENERRNLEQSGNGLYQRALDAAEKEQKEGTDLKPAIAALLLEQCTGGPEKYEAAKNKLTGIAATMPATDFIKNYLEAVWYSLEKSGMADKRIKTRLSEIEKAAMQLPDKETLVSDIISNGAEAQFSYFLYEDIDLLKDTITNRYSVSPA
ncbi:MAG TPA: radical SAM protein [Chitinophagales bacterium]|nr:radical SAM protein [Chitinophagales bacterium]